MIQATTPKQAVASPRLLTRSQAAQYCGLSSAQFSNWVVAGRLPQPLHGTHRWDRIAIDHALDKLSGVETKQSALEEWKATRARRA